jgi:hypothetical protein
MKRVLSAIGIGVAATLAPALPAATASAQQSCSIRLPVTYGEGWASLKIWQSCGDPAWVWAKFHYSPHYIEYGPHKIAPPDAPKYSVVGSGSGDGWGVPYCGGRARWFDGKRHYARTFGHCSLP